MNPRRGLHIAKSTEPRRYALIPHQLRNRVKFSAARIGTLAAGAALAVAVIVGCNKDTPAANGPRVREVHPAPAGATLKLAFVTNNASDFWKLAEKGVDKYRKESGVQVDMKMPPTGTVEEQNGIVENLVNQGYNGIAVSVIAPDDEVRQLNRAAKATNLITVDSDAAKSNRLLYIGTNNFEAGRELGRQIVKLLPKGGKMAVFVGTFSADNATQRLKGIEEEIKGHNIEVVARKEDNKDMAKARTNVEDILNSMPEVNLLVGLWSYNGPAISNAIDGNKKKGKVLAAVFDEEDGTLLGIENAIISCTVVQKPFMFGYLASKTLQELATKGEAALPKEETIDTGVKVINADNVKAFKAELVEMKK